MMLIFGYKSLRLYQATSTPLSRYYAPYCLALGSGLIIMSLPQMLTADAGAMRAWYLAGQLIVWLGLVGQAQVNWLLMFQNRLPRWFLTLPTLAMGLAIWGFELAGSHPRHLPNLIDWALPAASSVMAGLLLSFLLIPIAMFYARQAGSLPSRAARLRSLSISVMCIAIYAGELYIYLVLRGNEPLGVAIFDCLVFAGFMLTMIIPFRRAATQPAKLPA